MTHATNHPLRRLLGRAAATVLCATAAVAGMAAPALAIDNGDNGQVGVGHVALMEMRHSKTLDLAGTGLSVTLTDAEKAQVRADISNSLDAQLKDMKDWMRYQLVTTPDLVNDREALVASTIEHFGAASFFNQYMTRQVCDLACVNLAHEKPEFAPLDDNTYTADDEWSQRATAKRTAIIDAAYTFELSQTMAAKLRDGLGLSFEFDVVPLAADGSEDAAFGVGDALGETIERGAFADGSSSKRLSTVTFGTGATNPTTGKLTETYDEALVTFAQAVRAGNADAANTDMGTHALLYDGFALTSSDGLQKAYALDFWNTGEGQWPGYRSFGDSLVDPDNSQYLGDFDVLDQDWSYTATFNLHSNPAVTYTYDVTPTDGQVAGIPTTTPDLITGATFDSAGTLTSITKPLFTKTDLLSFMANTKVALSGRPDGATVHAFKLVEKDGGTAPFAPNTQEKVVLALADTQGNIEDLLIFDSLDDAKHAVESGDFTRPVTFTNEAGQTLSFTVKWDDDHDADGLRPSAQDFAKALTLAMGGEAYTRSSVKVTDQGNDTYAVSLTGAPKKDASGSDSTFALTEVVPQGYTSDQPAGGIAPGGTITNSHVPAKVSVSVAKAWDDANDADGLRPSSVKVELLANGAATGKTVELSAANGWKASFDGLAAKASGNPVAYTVQEQDVPSGYSVAVTGTAADGFTVTNTHTPAAKPAEPEVPVTPVKPETPAKPATQAAAEQPVVAASPATPQTDDPTSPAWLVAGAAGLALVGAGYLLRRRED